MRKTGLFWICILPPESCSCQTMRAAFTVDPSDSCHYMVVLLIVSINNEFEDMFEVFNSCSSSGGMPKEIPSHPEWFTQYVGPLFFNEAFHIFSNEGRLQILAIDPKIEEAICFNAPEKSIYTRKNTHLGLVGYQWSLSIVGYHCSSVYIWVLVDYSGQVWEKHEIDLGILLEIVIAPREEAVIGEDVVLVSSNCSNKDGEYQMNGEYYWYHISSKRLTPKKYYWNHISSKRLTPATEEFKLGYKELWPFRVTLNPCLRIDSPT
ncbi:hypothetical protein AMTRI_Chr08g163190 [Amborella trichopoda]